MTTETVLDALAAVFMIGGALLSLSAGLALLRFPDLLARMHAATKPQVLGLILILNGCAIRLGTITEITTLLLIVIFQLATSPVAAHMVGRAAYRDDYVPTGELLKDELEPDAERLWKAQREGRG